MTDSDAFPGLEQGTASTRRSLILLRWTLFLAAAAILISNHLLEPLPASAIFLMTTFGISNILLYVFWETYATAAVTDIVLAVVDTVFISLAIVYSGVAPMELFVLFFLVVFLVSLSQNLRQTVAAGVAVGFLYVFMTATLHDEPILQHPAILVRIPFLYSVALYFGYFAARATEDRRQKKEIVQERKELRALMDVIETINSSLDLHQVMLAITTKTAEALSLPRCSALLVEHDEKRGLVIASNDVPEVSRLEIDLQKYPEVRYAIETRSPVLIEDVQHHPLMHEVRDFIAGAGFKSILVVPMIHRDDLIGTLLLRATTTDPAFSPRVVSFCQAVGSASANALKNALLYRQMREESAQHRSTVEKLQSILEHSMDLIVTTDLDGAITDFNRTAEETLGYRRDEVLGRPLTDIYRGGGDRDEFLSALRGTGRIEDRGATMTTRDGARESFDLTVAVVRNELGEVVGSVCVGKKPTAIH